ncbi:MAG: hypothetical protein [Caudoviricetes sp.]|nr:MAG: hypothetical protein [Caudoviricetes sp.]
MVDMTTAILPDEQPPVQPTEAPAPTAGFGELYDVAAKRNHIMAAKEQSDKLMSYGAPVEGYKPNYDEVSKVSKDLGLNEEQTTVLSGSLSPEELQYRAQQFHQNNTDKKSLSDSGWKGIAADALAYMTDPAMIPAFAIKSPYVIGRTLGTLGIKTAQSAVMGVAERALGAGIVGAGTGLVQEAALSNYDETRDLHDVVIAGLSGMVGGVGFSTLADGGASLYRGATAGRRLGQTMDEVVEATNWDSHLGMTSEADHSLNQAITGRLDTSNYQKYFKGLESEIPDPVARKRVLSEGQAINQMIDDLSPIAEARMNRGARGELEADMKSGQHNMDMLNERIASVEKSTVSGSGKQLAIARSTRSFELASLRKQVADQQETLQQLQLTIEPHTTGVHAQAVSDISRLRNGIIPDNLKAKYLDLITPEDAAPAFTESKGNLPEPKQEATVLPEEAARVEDETLSTTVDKTEKPDTSIGAAEVKGAIIFPDTEGSLIQSTMGKSLENMESLGQRIPVTKAAGTTSIYGRVNAKMKSNTLRGLASIVFNDPHGAKTGIQSAVAFSDATRQRIMPKAVFIDDAAKNEYLRAANINPLELGRTNEALIRFDRDVSLKINELTDTTINPADSSVTRAAKARAAAYQDALETAKRYGVRGFEDVESRASYQPIIIGSKDMTSALDKYGEDAVKEVIARGYMGAKKPLTQKSSMIVAEAMLDRYYRRTSSVVQQAGKPSISGRLEVVKSELISNGIPEKEIQTVLNMLENKSLDDSISARAMDSLKPDINAASYDGLRFVDLMDTSLAGTDKYVREMTAQAAFARHGLKSRRQVEDTITEGFKQHRQEVTDLTNQYQETVARKAKVREGLDTSDLDKIITDYERSFGKGGKDLNSYRKFLDDFEGDYFDGIKAAFGEPIEDASGIQQVTSALGKTVNLMLLGFSGVAQVADLGITLARSGIGAVLRNLPTTTYNGVRSILPSAKYFMNNNELSNIAEVMGSVSHQDYLFGHKFMTGAEYGDAVIGHVSKADVVLDKINWLQSTMSLMRPVQGMIDELSARSLMTNLVQLSKAGAFTGKTRKAFLEIGKMDEANLDASLTHIKGRMDKGDDLFAAMRTLDPKLRDELGTAIRSVHTSNIGRSYFGELPAFTNKSYGKTLMKLQMFALTSYEKAVQRGVRNDQAGLIAATAFSAGVAYMWSTSDVTIQSLKLPEHKRDEFIKKKLDDQLAYTIAGRMSQVAMFSTLAQFYNLANPYQDSVLKPFGEYRGMASSGAIGKIGQAASSAGKLATDQSTDPDADAYKVYGAIPLLNTTMGMAILNTL